MYQNKDRISLFRSLISVRFLLTAFILVLTATGLRPGMNALFRRYTKKPIAIRRTLKEFEISSLPTFRNGWDFTREKLPVSEEALGTDEYLLMGLKSEDDSGNSYPKLLVVVTYYNDPNDKVPHTPEMCYTQTGGVIKKMSTIIFETSELTPDYARIPGRLLIFDMPKSNLEMVVLYCFCVEGKFRLSRNQVRWVIGKPGNRYTYFSKIEIASWFPSNKDPAKTIEICKTLFREVLSVLLKGYLPDKDQLKGR